MLLILIKESPVYIALQVFQLKFGMYKLSRIANFLIYIKK